MDGCVLLISSPDDDTAGMVWDALAQRGSVRVIWFDIADFPLCVSVAVTGPPWSGTLRTPQGDAALADVVGVLYRRPTTYRLPDALSDINRRFAVGEARMGFGGVLSGLDCRWVNHPGRMAVADFKPVQLEAAHAVGLKVPKTMLTNDPGATRSFIDASEGRVIYKSLTGFAVEQGEDSLWVYTSEVRASDVDDSLTLTMHQFQEMVPKAYDLRVTVVGEHVFPIAIDAKSEQARMDFRADYGNVSYRPVGIPDEVAKQLRAYLDHFDLAFGAFDLVVTPTGEHLFLECNCNGQWGWLEDATNLPIAEAMATYLIGE